jgi:hypothetical protein
MGIRGLFAAVAVALILCVLIPYFQDAWQDLKAELNEAWNERRDKN